MYDNDIHSVRSGNYHTLTLATPVAMGGSGTGNYNDLTNKPTIAGVEVVGDLTLEDLGLAGISDLSADVKASFKQKGQVETPADLENIQNPGNGDVYDVTEDGTKYYWDEESSQWKYLGDTESLEELTNEELDALIGSASTEATLRQLIANGGNIELASNIDLTDFLFVDHDTVLDLNGCLLSGKLGGYLITVSDDATLTLKNGTIDSSHGIVSVLSGGVVVEDGMYTAGETAFMANGSSVTVNDGIIVGATGCICASNGSTVEINGGSLTGPNWPCVYTNPETGRGGNSFVMNGGTLVGEVLTEGRQSCGVYIANDDAFTMNNGTILSTDGCGILMRAGHVVVNNGGIGAGKESHSPGTVGDDETLMSSSAVIYHESADYPAKDGMSLEINGGYFIGRDHSVEILSNESAPNVTINSGSFNPPVE